ncbi:uncharacterized protein BXZ73DRAFT_91529 [Epithele typhae]|uniref:uncharacterized protein n=1 Tax=Epithele typhae TaxID=378194 RepID=UPI0020082E4C|nr:uncharacterized protein BXZ73DRAFT_91529 [Epithele typhae]KAH9922805.1 hypothetical protein BXZ73DRAFT_91529 [Epithele typhae]
MATAVRHRIPFRFSEDDGQDGPILDEQEQEELIENLRKADESSNLIYHVGLEAVIGLSLVLSRKVSPLAVLLPDSPVLAIITAHPPSSISSYHPWFAAVGPAYALLLGRGLVDVLWWGVPAVITGVVAPVTKWVQDGEKDLQELEKLRYTARGA